jgi:hypothetical protein
MMEHMLKKTILLAAAMITIAISPLSAMAATDDSLIDGRLQGYGKVVYLDAGGTALSWLLMVALGVGALGVMFKSANRSHLD